MLTASGMLMRSASLDLAALRVLNALSMSILFFASTLFSWCVPRVCVYVFMAGCKQGCTASNDIRKREEEEEELASMSMLSCHFLLQRISHT